MNTKKMVVFLIAICNLQFAISAKAQSTFSLQQAIDYAMKNSSVIKNANLDEQITQYKIKEFKGIGLPQLKGTASINDAFQKQTFVFPSATGPTVIKVGSVYTTQAGLSASWLLLDASYFLGLEAQKEVSKMLSYSTQRSKIDIADQVSKAYYNVLIASKRLKLLQANIDRLNQTFKETKEYNKQGFIEGLDVQRLQIAVNNLQTEQTKINELFELGKSLLKFQMGYDVAQPIDLTDTLNVADIKSLSNYETTTTLNNRIEILMLNKQIELNKLNLKRYQLGSLPNLAAFSQFNTTHYGEKFDAFNSDANYFTSGLWGLQMNVTFFDGWQNRSRKAYTRLEILKNENDLANAKNGMQLELSNAKISMKNALLTIESQKENMDLANEVVRVTKIKYQQGVGSNLEVLNAETSLKEAQTNYFSALYDAYIAKVNFEKATGTLIK